MARRFDVRGVEPEGRGDESLHGAGQSPAIADFGDALVAGEKGVGKEDRDDVEFYVFFLQLFPYYFQRAGNKSFYFPA